MNSLFNTMVGLFFVYATVVTTVYCIRYGDEALSREELIALTRDHLGRKDPDEFLNGFFPVWAAIQFLVACFFLVITVISLVCYFLGCKTPPGERAKRVQ